MTQSTIKLFDRMKGVLLSSIFFFICQVNFGQTIADKKPYEAPAYPVSVKPMEQKVNVVKTKETVVSKPKNIAGQAEKVYISMENELKMSPAKVEENTEKKSEQNNTIAEPK